MKNLQELTIKDNFMFGAVMLEEKNCRDFLELVLGIPIQSLTIDKEKCLIYRPEYKGVRLDIIARDGANTRYNVEMQVIHKNDLGRRSRYYHSQIDMELLASGQSYPKLPKAFVIFICDFDPFGSRKYCYTFTNRCKEEECLTLDDGNFTIFLSTRGKNAQDISPQLVNFLNFVKASLKDSLKDFNDSFVRQLQDTINRIKASREMGEQYMLLEELLQDEREAGIATGITLGIKQVIFKHLERFGNVPSELQAHIEQETDPEVLTHWALEAANAASPEAFIRACHLDDTGSTSE